VITGEVLVHQLRGASRSHGVTLGANDQARFMGLTAPVTRALTPVEASELSNSFKASKADSPTAANASIVKQSQPWPSRR